MSIVLLLVGLLVTAAGFAAIGFGVPINAFSMGNTLIIAGSTAAAGGLVLIGLAAVVWQLQRVTARLPGRLAARSAEATNPMVPPTARMSSAVAANPVRPPEAPPRPPPEARSPEPRSSEYRPPEPRPYEARSSAPRPVETREPETRSSQPQPPSSQRSDTTPPPLPTDSRGPLSWLRAKPASTAGDAPPIAEVAAEAPSRDEAVAAPVEPAPEPRLDSASRAAPASERPKDSSLFDVDWPEKSGPAAAADSAKRDQPRGFFSRMRKETPAEARSAPSALAAPAAPAAPTAPAVERSTPAILKSGIIDGMAYTLYADGSIEAELPQGTLTFASVDALRVHLEKHGG